MLTIDGMKLMCDETLIATVPMATISILETALKGQEEMAILLEEQARRIATLQESLRQVGRIHPNEAVILQEIKKVVDERDDLRRRLENAEMLIEKLKEEVGHWEHDFAMFDRAHEKAINLWRKEHPDAGYTPDMSDLNEWMVVRLEKAESALRTAEESSVVDLIDSTPAKQSPNAADADGDGDSVIDEEVEE